MLDGSYTNLIDSTSFQKVAGIRLPDVPKRIGSGAHGVIYRLEGGKVLKITDDVTEAKSSAAIIGKSIPGVWHVYGVYQWKLEKSVWYIIGEDLDKDQKRATMAFTALLAYFKTMRLNDEDAYNSNKYKKAFQPEFESWIDERKKIPDQTKKDVKVLFNAMIALNDAGITFHDLHDGNIMFRNGKPVIVDLGLSVSRGGSIDVFESEELDKGSITKDDASKIVDSLIRRDKRKFGFLSDIDIEEIRRGIEVEHEHMGTIRDFVSGKLTVDPKNVAARIASDHLREDPKYYSNLDEEYRDEFGRPSAAKRGYGHKWKQKRDEIMDRDQKKCVKCGKRAREVDHVTPKSRKGKDINSNLRALCASCHRKKTAAYDAADAKY